ncbi:MAG: outer membrane lipoprotein-sorting protein [Myxococcales bacterium]|nr:outer membrane lipoprotein-sorting protein [Myxococcales bacterium]
MKTTNYTTIGSMTSLLFAALLLTSSASAQTAEEIVKKMDENMTFNTRTGNATLEVVRAGQATDTRTLRLWGRGFDDSYSEFLTPARDQGVKYLKIAKSLHMYLPRTEKVMTISGHLLRESIMDSDFSYEDMLEARALLADYDAKLLGSETFNGEDCWLLELTAKREGVSYYRRKLWISKKTYVAMKMERYAETGLLLKTMTARDIKVHGGRNYPMVLEMQDAMRKGSKTTFTMSNVVFDVAIPESTFSRRNLMKGN